jgi:hypothetical protein
MRKAAKAHFESCAKEIFDKYPKLHTFSWRQYTPYFNDGSECEFSVNTSYLDINGRDDNDNDAAFKDLAATVESAEGVSESALSPEEFDEIHDETSAFLETIDEDDMLALFGDHMRIIAKRDGTTDEEKYDHD